MSTLDRKLLRDLSAARGMLLAIMSIIAVGVACYVAMGSAHRNLTVAQRLYYAQCRMADFWIDVKKAPLAELESIAQLSGVVEIRPRIAFNATVDLERVVEPLNGLVLSLPDHRAPVLNDIVLTRGGYFTDRRRNEVIVNDAFARRHGLYPGQKLYLLMNKQRQEMAIVGTAISSEFTYSLGAGSIVPDPAHFGIFYIKQTFAEDVFDFAGAANQVVGRLTPQMGPRPDALLARMELLLDPYGVAATTPLADQASNRYLTNEIEGLGTFGAVMPAIFLVVAALVLNVLMSRLAEQQRVVIGTLKAVGYSNAQLFVHFLKFGLCVGALGGALGCYGGYWLAEGMTIVYRQFFEFPELSNHFFPDVAGIGMLISLVCALAGTLHGARAVLRLEPAVAMRAKPPAQGGAIFLERARWFWNRLSFGWRMTLRNIVRNRLRTAAGIFAATMGASVMVNGFMMARSIRDMVDLQFNKMMRSDVDLAFKGEHGLEALAEVRELPGVDYAEPVWDVVCEFANGPVARKGAISGLAAHARLTVPRDADGLPLRLAPVGLTMSRKMAQVLHLSLGDTVTVKPVKGLRQARDVPVVAIADTYLGLSVYADIGYLSRLFDEELAMTGAQLTVLPGSRALNELYRQIKELPAVQSVNARADTIHNVMETVVKNQRVFITLLVLFAGVIFFSSVLNSSLVSLAERQREVATLRVLGYTEWQIGGLFLRDSIVTNIVGTLVGLPVGYMLSVQVARSYDTDMFRIPVPHPGWIWVWTFLLGVAFGLAAHLVVQRAIFRMDWLEAVKTKE